jgi:thiol:disulfide interchange protein
MKLIRKALTILIFTLFSAKAITQIYAPVKWINSYKHVSDNTYELIFKANIQEDWHVYGLNIPDGGPIRTTINYLSTKNFEPIGKLTADKKPVTSYDSTFEMDIELFSGSVQFRQLIKVKSYPAEIKGSIDYQSCNDMRCLTLTNEFQFMVEGNQVSTVNNSVSAANEENKPEVVSKPAPVKTNISSLVKVNSTEPEGQSSSDKLKVSLWSIFFAALGKGILSVFTPCVFPVIPLIIAFFMNNNSTRKRIFQTLLFAVSIIAFYVLTGLVAGLAKLDLTMLSKYWYVNFILFLLLLTIALSFFGMFEITLPGSWSNKLDQQVDKGGFWAPFFLAMATVVVSFSCVGPIAAHAIASALKGELVQPVVAMFGFSLSFTLPFIIIGIFPVLLSKLPKSGGWLNSVKVVFAFVIFASSFIFLGNIGWKFVTRDVVLSIETITFILLGFYLLGKIKFPHDSDLKVVKVPRFLLALFSFAFAVYLIPGLFGSPLKAVSAYLPSQETSELSNLKTNFTQTTGSSVNSSEMLCDAAPKYAKKYHLPYGLPSYFDYEEGLACARTKNKPVLLYFTGYSCKNCKNMYSEVWSDQRVQETLRNKFIIVSLFVDDTTSLFASDRYISSQTGREITTVGRKNSEFEIDRFASNSQPLFVIINAEGKVISGSEPYTYSPDIEKFQAFLDNAIQNYQ